MPQRRPFLTPETIKTSRATDSSPLMSPGNHPKPSPLSATPMDKQSPSDKRPDGLFYSRSEHGSTNNLMHGGLEENPNQKLRELFEMLSHDTGLDTSRLFHNSSAARLYEDALKFEEGSVIVSSGALATFSGSKTGRCPKDKRVVAEPDSEKDVWWGPVNIPIDEHTFSINRERAVDYLKTRKRIYVFDGFAGWDPKYRIKVRVICARAYHALFMNNMLIRPTEEELENFGQPDFTILNAGEFPANKYTTGMTSETSVIVNFHKKEMGNASDYLWFMIDLNIVLLSYIGDHVCGRDEKGHLYRNALFDAQTGSPFPSFQRQLCTAFPSNSCDLINS